MDIGARREMQRGVMEKKKNDTELTSGCASFDVVTLSDDDDEKKMRMGRREKTHDSGVSSGEATSGYDGEEGKGGGGKMVEEEGRYQEMKSSPTGNNSRERSECMKKRSFAYPPSLDVLEKRMKEDGCPTVFPSPQPTVSADVLKSMISSVMTTVSITDCCPLMEHHDEYGKKLENWRQKMQSRLAEWEQSRVEWERDHGSELRRLREENGRMEEENVVVGEKNEWLQTEYNRLIQENEQLRARLTEDEKKMKKLEDDLESAKCLLKKNAQEAAARAAERAAELERITAANTEISRERDLAMQKARQIQYASQVREAEAVEQLQQMQQLQREMDVLQSQLLSLQTELISEKTEKTKHEEAVFKVKEDLDRSVAAKGQLEADLERLNEARDTLDSDYKKQTAEMERLRDARDQLEADFKQQREDMEMLKMVEDHFHKYVVSVQIREERVNEKDADISLREANLGKMQKRIDDLEKENEKIKELENENEKMEEEMEMMRRELARSTMKGEVRRKEGSTAKKPQPAKG